MNIHISRRTHRKGFKYEYGPFGEVFCSVGDMAKVNPFQFSTQYTDNETDLLYYGYRYYSPAQGRWMSRDPLGEPGFENTSNRPKNKSPRKKREDFLLGRIRSINPILAEEFRTQLAKLDVTDADSKERQNAVNLYAFIGNDPLTHYDYLGLIKVCTRPLEGLKCTTVIVHCYLDLGNGQTYSYDPNGIHADPNPNSPKKRCVDVSLSTITARDVMNQVMSDLAGQQWMGGMCPAGDYTFTGHNWCHWVDHVLTSLGYGGVEGYFPGYSLP